MVFEDFYEVLEELVKSVVTPNASGSILTDEGLLETFQDPESASYQFWKSLHTHP